LFSQKEFLVATKRKKKSFHIFGNSQESNTEERNRIHQKLFVSLLYENLEQPPKSFLVRSKKVTSQKKTSEIKAMFTLMWSVSKSVSLLVQLSEQLSDR
jgi:hypothetical protein